MAERENMYIEKGRGHLSGCYKLGQSFNNRGLTNTSFADEYWIIFRLAEQCCNNAFDGCITTADRLKLVAKRGSGQVARETLK
jgi:hypothetical protein